MYERLTQDQFIVKCELAHNYKYTYKKTIFETMRSDIVVTCHQHGDYTTRAHRHANGGGGCTKCQHSNCSTGVDLFTQKANQVHDSYYDYSMSVYKNARTPIDIICPKHSNFSQTPDAHLRGSGCPSCASYGFDMNKPAILYYLSICGGTAYKIGITNRDVKSRFRSDISKIKILRVWHFKKGSAARSKEKAILTQFSAHKYSGKPLLSNGNSELFTIDVLQLE
jgi:hypothetical protein